MCVIAISSARLRMQWYTKGNGNKLFDVHFALVSLPACLPAFCDTDRYTTYEDAVVSQFTARLVRLQSWKTMHELLDRLGHTIKMLRDEIQCQG